MMKRIFLLFFPCFSGFLISAQVQTPEDALRMSGFRPSGTAREQAIGGAMGSLGGDITASFVNPAGLGFYKTADFVLSPAWSFNHANSSYLSNASNAPSTSHFVLGTTGLVYGWATDPDKSAAISLSANQMANFNGHSFYKGNNSYSSASEAYVEELSNYTGAIDDIVSDPSLSRSTRSAYYTYLIDTSGPTGLPIISQAGKVLTAGGQLAQSMDMLTSGGITEIALGLASNSHDKLYLGISLGVPIVNYTKISQYTESDPAGTTADFGSYTYTEKYTSKGVGLNARLGAIYRPNMNWRIGLAVHTPSFYSLTDHLSSSMTTDSKSYAGVRSVNSYTLDSLSNTGNDFEYDLQTPWHIVLSGTYVFPGAVTTGKMGFITTDIEYVVLRGSRFSLPTDDYGNSPDDTYYDGLNSVISSYFKNQLNFRLGGEYKVDELAFRVGGSYMTNPYAVSAFKADRITVSGGLGYRKKGIFIDLTYVESILNDIDVPYRLTDKDNSFASIKQSSGNLLLTFGFKF